MDNNYEEKPTCPTERRDRGLNGHAVRSTQTRPPSVQEHTHVMSVVEAVGFVAHTIDSLESLKDRLSPNSTPPAAGECGPARPISADVTFDYIWANLPDEIYSFSNRIDCFSSFIKDMIYKNSSKGEDGDNQESSDYVCKVNEAIMSFGDSIDCLAKIPDVLKGVDGPQEVCTVGSTPAFSNVWRNMATCLTTAAERISKIQVELEGLFFGLDGDMPPCDDCSDTGCDTGCEKREW